MQSQSFSIAPVAAGDDVFIEQLLDRAFGLGRRTKTSYRLREGSQPIAGLSLAARDPADRILGAISFWPLRIGAGGAEALLLGPLAVDPALQGKGIGLALMQAGLEIAAGQGHGLVILVGDEPYYARVGFSRVPGDRLMLPGPVDPARLLWRELVPGAADGVAGLVLSPQRFAEASAAFTVPHEAEQEHEGREA